MLFFKRFWGWGGEDDDLRRRLQKKDLNITLVSPELGRFRVNNQYISPISSLKIA